MGTEQKQPYQNLTVTFVLDTNENIELVPGVFVSLGSQCSMTQRRLWQHGTRHEKDLLNLFSQRQRGTDLLVGGLGFPLCPKRRCQRLLDTERLQHALFNLPSLTETQGNLFRVKPHKRAQSSMCVSDDSAESSQRFRRGARMMSLREPQKQGVWPPPALH